MPRNTVFVDEITAGWIAETIPAIATSFREEGASTATAAAAAERENAVAAARTEAATAERERILAIQQATPRAHAELGARLIAEGVPLASAHQQILAAINAADAARRGARLDALQEDEQDLNPPAPGPTPEKNVNQAAKDAVALAVKNGVIR